MYAELSLSAVAGRPASHPRNGRLLADAYGISALPIDEESALHVIKLPVLHADPFDRMLVSQAIIHGLTIVTPDPLVTQYPARTVW